MAAISEESQTKVSFSSFIRGFHVYRDIWSPQIDEVLDCVLDLGNGLDKFAVSVQKNGKTVGHIPRENSKVCHFFLKRGGTIAAKVTGKRQNNGFGLEIPALYTFTGNKKDTQVLPKLLKGLSKATKSN